MHQFLVLKIKPIFVIKKEDIFLGASGYNQNRLHLGFHYPRDLKTAKQSLKGFNKFKNSFKECINENFVSYYYIAKKDSLTSINFKPKSFAIVATRRSIDIGKGHWFLR